jgi:hypothetical protein
MSCKPVNAIKHLSWPGKKKPQCWKCWHWTGAKSAGLVVCVDTLDFCTYRRVRIVTLWHRWWSVRKCPSARLKQKRENVSKGGEHES